MDFLEISCAWLRVEVWVQVCSSYHLILQLVAIWGMFFSWKTSESLRGQNKMYISSWVISAHISLIETSLKARLKVNMTGMLIPVGGKRVSW